MFKMSNNSQNVINCIRKRKENLQKLLGSKCCICGFDLYNSALEFHHVDPQTKEFGISASNATTKALEKQLEEAKKCVLVCANCHRGIHEGKLSVPENWQDLYDINFAQELIHKKELLKTRKIHYCKRCGREISSGADYCPECASFIRRTCDRPSREELKILIREKPFTQIAEIYGVSDNAIRKWCDGYKLPRKKSEINSYTIEEWEKI